MSILLREELVRRPTSFNLIVYIYISSLPFKKLQWSMGTLNIELTPNKELASCLLSVASGNDERTELLFPPTTGEEASVLFLLFEIM